MASIDNRSSSVTAWSDCADLERGPLNLERIVLRINGLTSGCFGTGITRAVSCIRPIDRHQLNLVTARLDLDLDTNRLSAAEVIKQLNTKTGYTFEQHVSSAGQTLDLMTSDLGRIQQASQPYGVSRLEAPEKESWRSMKLLSGHSSILPCKAPPSRTRMESDVTVTNSEDEESPKTEITTSCPCQPVQIHCDANTIGARTLFDYYRRFDPLLKLAPPSKSTTLGTKLVRQSMYSFLPALALTVPVLVIAWAPLKPVNFTYTHISLGLATTVQLVAFHVFASNATRTLYRSRLFDVDALIALSTSMAYTLSLVSYVYQLKGEPLETGSFLETYTLLVTLVLLGRVIIEFARYRYARSVSFGCLQINEALLVKADPNAPMDPDPKTKRTDARLLQYGDRFKVPPHTRVVTDGVVICGGSEINESRITGEPIRVAKGVQSMVYAGTTNGSGTLIVELTALPHENSVHRIATMVEDAELTKLKMQAFTDRIAAWSVPAIAAISLAVFLIWLFVEKYHQHSWENAVVTATTYAIATLLVCCPYGIGLAVPMVVLIASSVAARHGIIFRNPQALETARLVTDMVLDQKSLVEATDDCRPADLISKLLGRGIAVHMIGSEDKALYIQELQRRKGSVVLYVGNGTNDALALQQAHVGVKTNNTSKSTADVILMAPRLSDLLLLLDISHAAHRRIVINVTWSALYTLSALALAAGAFAGLGQGDAVRIQAPWAGLGELVGVAPLFAVAWSVRWVGKGA